MTTKKGSYQVWHTDTYGLPGSVDKQTSFSQDSGHIGDNDSRAELAEDFGGTEEEREQWGNKAEFILSCIGLSVGLGNVWRFPYLAYANGGAAFLIAYIILQLLIGKPMYFMELVMGQYSGSGPTKVWRMNPAAKGIGVSMCMISLIVSIYYNIIMAYTLYYFFASMQETLPWTQCSEEWIRDYNCVSKYEPSPAPCTLNMTQNQELGKCSCTGNSTIDNSSLPFNMSCTPKIVGTSSAELYFYKEVIQISSDMEPSSMGAPLYRIVLCLILSWTIVVFCLIKGIKSSGKVVYFTATFPYVILLILLVRGSLLDGAKEGVEFFIIPEWKKLADLQVWVAAAGQMFFSLGVSFGGIIMFGSYNKFTNKVYSDSLLISLTDMITSIIAGFVVFTAFGGMAKATGRKVSEVAKSGYGMAFVVYPEALSNLPPSQLWSVLFFFMLFTLGLDSEFGMLETVITCIQDEFPKLKKYKTYICIGLSCACFLMALPCTCPGGDYVVTIMDHYGSDFALLIVSCFEVISVMWVYGAMRFLKDIQYMLGSRPHGWPYWVFCWTVTAPLLIGLMFLYRMVQYKPPSYSDGTPYPHFAQSIGWTLLSLVLCPIPLGLIWRLIQSFSDPSVTTFKSRLHFLFSPSPDWGPNDKSARKIRNEAKNSDDLSMEKLSYDNATVIRDSPEKIV
ncbi:sodium- and chloride-dependent neutral and basic amino acid transporter B(0+)-like [Biomphalaria glabrata]|uniref:Transporter n=2 Tax=Biomphalaria glabrata TaxID=6526 RepID=A0A9W2YMR6_BIOGL|nr:sodium- and chloride-dependent neutral and basic amino acid transporter B(0+)-like [Biomphalaria glabrata]